jgi:hypothetical protein
VDFGFWIDATEADPFAAIRRINNSNPKSKIQNPSKRLAAFNGRRIAAASPGDHFSRFAITIMED